MSVLGLVLPALGGCGNITLTNSDFGAPGVSGGSSAPSPDAGTQADASPPGVASTTDAGGGAAVTSPTFDAGTASVSTGSVLCFYGYGMDAGAHTCQPDTSSQCAAPATSSDDAGVYTGWEDAGEGGALLSACHVVANGQVCAVAGAGGDGAQCQSSADCAESFECVGSPGQCRHYCCNGNAACDAASDQTTGTTFCDVQTTTDGSLSVPICAPVRSCTPLLIGTGAGTCPDGETCAVVKDDGTTSCVAIGPVGIGGDCDVLHCRAELTCLGTIGSRTCFELCEVDSPACSTGTCESSAQLFTNANVGICQ